MYYFRNPAAINAAWADINGGFLSKSIGTQVTSFDPTLVRHVVEMRIPASGTITLDNPSDDMDFNFVAGDYLLFTMQAKANTQGGITVELAEEV
jgi:hypothetical protein